MDFVLLGIEFLCATLLLLALVFAVEARSQKRWLKLRVLFPIINILLLYFGICILTGLIKYNFFHDSVWFNFCLVLTACYLIGAIWLCIAGFRRKNSHLAFPASTWPLGVLRITFAIVLSAHLMTFWIMDILARHQQALLRTEAGILGLSLAPLQVYERDNAASIYQQAGQALKSAINKMPWEPVKEEAKDNEKPITDLRTQRAWERWSDALDQHSLDPKDSALSEFLHQQAGTIALIHEATKRPVCYLSYNFCQPSNMRQGPEIENALDISMLLVLDASVKAAKGDIPSAIEDINAIYRFAKQIGDEPFQRNALRAFAIDKQGSETFISILAAHRFSPDDLNAIKLESALPYQKVLQEALRFEEAANLYHLAELGDTESLMINRESDVLISLIYRIFMLEDEIKAAHWYADKTKHFAVQPYYFSKGSWEYLIKKIKDDPKALFSSNIYFFIDAYAKWMARAEAYRNIADIALAICRYQAKYGQYPDKLDSLMPEFISFVPDIFYSGNIENTPLRLKKSEHGVVIYHIGLDGVDDGGVPLDQKTEKGDIVFELPDKKIRD